MVRTFPKPNLLDCLQLLKSSATALVNSTPSLKLVIVITAIKNRSERSMRPMGPTVGTRGLTLVGDPIQDAQEIQVLFSMWPQI